MDTLVEMLEQVIRMRGPKTTLRYPGVEAAVLEHGVRQTVVPTESVEDWNFPDSTAKECYYNAWSAASRNHLTYVEGFALVLGVIPTQHAWVVDSDGNFIDPTWGAQNRTAPVPYIGIKFEQQFVTRSAIDNGFVSMLSHGNQFLDIMERGLAFDGDTAIAVNPRLN